MLKPRENSILIEGNYRIVGFKDYQNACLNCIKLRIRDNLNVQKMHSQVYVEDMIDKNILKSLERDLETTESEKVYIYDVIDKSISQCKPFYYPKCQCHFGRELPVDYHSVSKISWPNYRQHEFEELVDLLSQNLQGLLHPVFGVLKNHYIGTSDVMPLVALEGKFGSRTFDAYGRHSTYRTSYYTAILEGLERVHGIAPFHQKSIQISENKLKDIGDKFLSLHDLINYSNEEYENPNFTLEEYDCDKEILWVETKELTTDEKYYIPEQVVYFSTELVNQQTRHLYESSNGMAIGSSWEEAIISGLLEVIERDSFLSHWYLKKSPIRIENINELNSLTINMMLKYLSSIGYKAHLFDVSLESAIPSIWVLLESKDNNDGRKLAYYTAGGSNFDFTRAIESALIEASTSVKVYNRLLNSEYSESMVNELIKDFGRVKRLEEHIYLFSSSQMSSQLSFAIQTPYKENARDLKKKYETLNKELQSSSQKELLEKIIKRVGSTHKNIFVTRLTSPSLLEMGLECVKVTVPSMQNISFGHQYKNINLLRLSQVSGKDIVNIEVNHTPHPFP